MLARVVELLACWKGRFARNDFNIVWHVIPCLIMVHSERKESLEF
jgi:hypothetical protein